ncbi:hypothetical protein ADIMK_2143 [Marinobacterium lacunae]|uniref:Uncharacterized protein n=1 Tax=Marinobacterium lacunae TaxID=1232683 RepID=A0A081FYT2_9GAMM|nr:hypothetical protein ADIMK_2143 [Marinobacterium lacunae]
MRNQITFLRYNWDADRVIIGSGSSVQRSWVMRRNRKRTMQE